jgi:DNA repair exonuclease SbcCD nuclease subunit
MNSKHVNALIIGDIHVKHDNIPEINIFIDKLEQLALEKKPDFILLLGDNLDTHEKVLTLCLNKIYEIINRLRRISIVFTIIGNHDLQSNNEFLSDKHWCNAVKEWKNVTVVDNVVETTIHEKKFVFCPYVYPGRFVEALNTIGDSWKGSKCIFAHQEIKGCKMGAVISVEGDPWPVENPQLISGHIHANQRIQRNVYYPGSALQNAFGESERNIVAYVTFDDTDEYKLEEIDLGLPRKYIVYKSIDDIESYAPDSSKKDDKVKLSISGVYEEFKSFKKTKKYKEIVESGVKVVFKPKRSDNKATLEKLESMKEVSLTKNVDESHETNFRNILQAIVDQQKNNHLSELYELVVNNREVSADSFLFL